MLIALDAGHYLGTPGKRCLKAIDPGETREWVLNGRVADKVEERLTAYDCKTMRVDDPTGRTEINLFDRVLAANRAGADVYLSIHHNAGINGGSGGGIVVYVCYGVDKETITLQKAIYQHTVLTTGLRGNRSNPLATAAFYVLENTRMPAVLGEFGFMDSTTDTPIILTEEYADQLAYGIVAALVEVYGLKEVDNVTYEEWVAFYERYQKEQAKKEPTEKWQKDTVKKAIAAGISDGSRPLDKMTRVEGMAMVLAGKDI